MAIIEKTSKRPEIDLTGPDGNAFALLAMGRKWAKQLGKDWEPIMCEATSGDYENLILVLDREFGDYVDFAR